MELIVFEQSGWIKPVKIEKSITRVGSAAGNDVQIDSTNISPVQLQIIYSPEQANRCKVMNLSGTLNLKSSGKLSALPAFTTVDMYDGDEIELAEYRLQVKLPLNSSLLKTSSVIDASLRFSDPVLRPEYPTTGQLTIKNNGEREAGQFLVSITGLPEDCFHIDPVPLMYPGAQEETGICLFHHMTYPLAGYHTLTVTVSAPDTYPGEVLLLQQKLFVSPVARQGLEISDDVKAVPYTSPESQPVVSEKLPPPAQPEIPQTLPAISQPITVETQPAEPDPVMQIPEVPTSQIQDIGISTISDEKTQLVASDPLQPEESLPTKIAPSLPFPEPVKRNSNEPIITSKPEPEPEVSEVKVPAIKWSEASKKPKVVHGPADEFWDQ